MSLLEVILFVVFIVPIIAGCLLFVLCAMWMQMQEDQQSSQKHGMA